MIVVIGIISSQLLPLELFPELDIPMVSVEIPYPGSTPEEVERQITKPIEEAVATVYAEMAQSGHLDSAREPLYLQAGA